MKINPEEALRKSNKKFVGRFKEMEKINKQSDFTKMSLEEKEGIWETAKQNVSPI